MTSRFKVGDKVICKKSYEGNDSITKVRGTIRKIDDDNEGYEIELSYIDEEGNILEGAEYMRWCVPKGIVVHHNNKREKLKARLLK